MFNRGKFNTLTFNRRSDLISLTNIDFTISFGFELEGIVTEKPRLQLKVNDFNNTFSLVVQNGLIKPSRINEFGNYFALETKGNALIGLKSKELNNSFSMNLGANLRITLQAKTFDSFFVESLIGSLKLPLRLKTGLESYFVLLLSPTTIQYEFATLNTIIKPGQTLIIDTCNYSVTLDGVNIIEQYSGQWFKLVPDSSRIRAAFNGNSNVDMKLEYTERWL